MTNTTSQFNAKNGLSVGGANGQAPVNVITSTGDFTPNKVIVTSSIISSSGLYEHSANVTINYAILPGNNAVSAGPITINANASVTVPSGSTWSIV